MHFSTSKPLLISLVLARSFVSASSYDDGAASLQKRSFHPYEDHLELNERDIESLDLEARYSYSYGDYLELDERDLDESSRFAALQSRHFSDIEERDALAESEPFFPLLALAGTAGRIGAQVGTRVAGQVAKHGAKHGAQHAQQKHQQKKNKRAEYEIQERDALPESEPFFPLLALAGTAGRIGAQVGGRVAGQAARHGAKHGAKHGAEHAQQKHQQKKNKRAEYNIQERDALPESEPFFPLLALAGTAGRIGAQVGTRVAGQAAKHGAKHGAQHAQQKHQQKKNKRSEYYYD